MARELATANWVKEATSRQSNRGMRDQKTIAESRGRDRFPQADEGESGTPAASEFRDSFQDFDATFQRCVFGGEADAEMSVMLTKDISGNNQ